MKKSASIIVFLLIMALAFCGCDKKEENNKKEIENITRYEEEKEPDNKEVILKEDEENTDENIEEQEKVQEDEKETDSKSSQPLKSLAEICNEIKQEVSASDAMDLDLDAICNLYAIDTSWVKDASGFVVMAGTFPHEVVMVEAKDSDSAAKVESMLKVKYNSFVEQSKGYDAQNYALAQKCKVERKGNHISMFLSPDFEVIRTIYSKFIK